MLQLLLTLVGLLSLAYFILKLLSSRIDFLKPTEYWDWDDGNMDHLKRKKIDTSDISFPKNFLWGTATASHQIEGGCTNNNWHQWEHGHNVDANKPRIKKGQKSGKACDHWNRIEEDISLMKELGVNSYRFSVAWSKIEPKKGEFDESVLKHYDKEIDALIANNIEPMLTLHHFEHPLWFEQAGSFEKEENIKDFVNFSHTVFMRWAPRVKFWCTINEPEVFVTGGWCQGIFPPGKTDIQMAATVMKNLLESHVQVYHKLKKTPLGNSVQIGIVKDIFHFHPYNPLNPLDRFGSGCFEWVMNDNIIEFFKSGNFNYTFPGIKPVKHFNADAKTSNDFIGLNYYSHYHMKFNPSNPHLFDSTHQPNVLMTDMSYPMYPEGLYSALKRLSVLKLPLYVTECGVADADDSRRSLFIKRYLYALSKAIKDGMDVRGFYYWSLMDNFEWAEGYEMRFGLFHVDFETQKRTLRDGAKPFVDVVKKFSSKKQ